MSCLARRAGARHAAIFGILAPPEASPRLHLLRAEVCMARILLVPFQRNGAKRSWHNPGAKGAMKKCSCSSFRAPRLSLRAPRNDKSGFFQHSAKGSVYCLSGKARKSRHQTAISTVERLTETCSGISSPSARRSSMCNRMASLMFSTASSYVSPWL